MKPSPPPYGSMLPDEVIEVIQNSLKAAGNEEKTDTVKYLWKRSFKLLNRRTLREGDVRVFKNTNSLEKESSG